MESYNLDDAVTAAGQSIRAIQQLSQADTAIKILPADTKFAIVIEGIQKGISDSFYETDVTTVGVLPFNIQVTSEGMVGRFMGYLSFSETKARIYQTLDLNAVASAQQATTTENDIPQARLLLEDDIINLTLSLEQGSFVLHNATVKFKIVRPYPVLHLNGQFESSATGNYGGLRPTLNYLTQHGAQTQAALKLSRKVSIVAVVLIILATLLVLVVLPKL